MMSPAPHYRLPARDPETGDWNVVVETPRGSRNKFKFDDKAGVFSLSGVLPAGAVFPFDFGYLPATLGPDGDPLDALVLMDEPAFPGCLVPTRLIGVIAADQTERNGKTTRNDRLIAVASASHTHKDLRALRDLNKTLVAEIEHFFVSYNQARGKRFKPRGRLGVAEAERIVGRGMKAYATENGPAGK